MRTFAKILTANKRSMTLLTASAGLILVALIVQPLMAEHSAVDMRIKTVSGKLRKYRAFLSARGADAAAGTIPKHQPGSVTDALVALERLARESAVKIGDMRPEAVEGKTTQVTLRINGTPENYIRFLYGLERSGLRLRLKRLRMNAKPGSDEVEGMCVLGLLVTQR